MLEDRKEEDQADMDGQPSTNEQTDRANIMQSNQKMEIGSIGEVLKNDSGEPTENADEEQIERKEYWKARIEHYYKRF